MKSKEELNVLKAKVNPMTGKYRELTDAELAQVTGGEQLETAVCYSCNSTISFYPSQGAFPCPYCKALISPNFMQNPPNYLSPAKENAKL